jgi:Ca2+-binding RTX toxin-like protein
VTIRLWLLGAALALPLAAPATAATWHGTVQGIQVRSKKEDFHSSPDVTDDSAENYQVTLKFSFTISSSGAIDGTGKGSYDDLHWHLSGVNGDKGAFDCDVPVTGNDFPVVVGGFVSHGHGTLSLSIPEAEERNDDYDCGADFKGFSTTSHYMAESLTAVDGSSLKFSASSPAIAARTNDKGSSSNDTVTLDVQNIWSFSLTPPGGGSGSGGGGGGTAGKTGDPPNVQACTIFGTAHADTLTGTPGRDVICGFGGNDTIKGLGGNDVIYGGAGKDKIDPGDGRDVVDAGPGNDRISAKDGARDKIDGGPGRDRAQVDKSLDRVKNVEHVS